MSEGEFDDELRMALKAAFGDDSMMDSGETQDSPGVDLDLEKPCVDSNICRRPKLSTEELDWIFPSEEILAAQDLPGKDDLSSRIRWMKGLSKAIYSTTNDSKTIDLDCDSASQKTDRVVVFSIGDHEFGLPLKDVKQIAQRPSVTPLPFTPQWLRGLINLRGQVLSATDLRSLLGIQSLIPRSEKIIVVRCESSDESTAIVADRVVGIRSTSENASRRRVEGTLFGSISNIEGSSIPVISTEHLFEMIQLANR